MSDRRIDEAAERAKTLEEFSSCALARGGLLDATTGHLKEPVQALAWIIRTFPHPEPKPSDLDRLAAAMTASNKAASRRDRICLLAKGTVGLIKWDGMAGRFAVPPAEMSVDDMIAYLEKTTPVTIDRVKEIITELLGLPYTGPVPKLASELQRYFEQKEGESDE